MLTTLTEWDRQNFTKGHSINTLRKWARSGRIQPTPILVGREYQVDEDAKYTAPNTDRAHRLRQARAMQNNEQLNEVDPRVLEILNNGSCAA